MSFSSINEIFLSFVLSKNYFFDSLAQKARSQKHKELGFQHKQIFEQHLPVTNRPFLDPKNQNPKFQLSFLLPFSSLWKTQHTKICWNLHFCRVLASLKENFQKFDSKQGNLKITIFAPNFGETNNAIFGKLADNWPPKKHKMMTECAKIAWDHYQNSQKSNWPR